MSTGWFLVYFWMIFGRYLGNIWIMRSGVLIKFQSGVFFCNSRAIFGLKLDFSSSWGDVKNIDRVIFGRYVGDIWMIFGWNVNVGDIWMICVIYGWYLDDMWVIYRWYVGDIWIIYGWYLDDMWMISRWYHPHIIQISSIHLSILLHKFTPSSFLHLS